MPPDREQAASLNLLWCPVCGRDDRYMHLNRAPRWHHKLRGGGRCEGEPVELTYVPLPSQPTDDRPESIEQYRSDAARYRNALEAILAEAREADDGWTITICEEAIQGV